MMKRLSGAVLLVCALGYAAIAFAEPSVLVRTEAIKKMPLPGILKAYGAINMDTRHSMNISFAHAGAVSRLMVTAGQAIKRGALLLEFSTDPAESFAYGQAATAVDYARESLARTEALAKQRLATQAQLAASRKALVDAEANLDILRRQGKGAGTEHAVAPFDGIVTRLDVKPGDRVPSGASLLQLARTASLMADLGVEPEEIARVCVGMTVHIRPVFDRKKKAVGKVMAVNGIINPQTRLVDVQVRIAEDQTDHLIPGMQILGEIILGSREYLVVPRSAVLRDDKGAHIFQIDQGRAGRVDVTTDEETDDVVAIGGDFNPDLKVVVQGNYELRDKMAVREDVK